MDPSHHFQFVSVSRQMCARLGWIIIGIFAFHGSLSFSFSDLYLKQAVMDGHANRRLTAGHHLFMQRTSCRERLLYTTYMPTEILSVLCTASCVWLPTKVESSLPYWLLTPTKPILRMRRGSLPAPVLTHSGLRPEYLYSVASEVH